MMTQKYLKMNLREYPILIIVVFFYFILVHSESNVFDIKGDLRYLK